MSLNGSHAVAKSQPAPNTATAPRTTSIIPRSPSTGLPGQHGMRLDLASRDGHGGDPVHMVASSDSDSPFASLPGRGDIEGSYVTHRQTPTSVKVGQVQTPIIEKRNSG